MIFFILELIKHYEIQINSQNSETFSNLPFIFSTWLQSVESSSWMIDWLRTVPWKTYKHKTILWLVARVASDHSKLCTFPLALQKHLEYIETLQNIVCFKVFLSHSLIICCLYNILSRTYWVMQLNSICDTQQS